ncbi:TrfB-related DNA-binding protein [Paraburkholderia largidicola]|uniref:TrfB transcriptional repressor protein domain-containing protein n=1 Tax=Paraburkholderia largidicola TaxID=3014751 RepID=A0A7I8C4A3_9BURK|nr:TrfB-related DNA-binding protein [Paraburkholderia sp. PGU16]BCF95405.1 hypothetical protein PPGU16_84720 [Paraburkholderia sp. PGU16]
MPAKRKMSAPDFEAVRPMLNISPARIDAARAVLVDGKTLQAVATANGWKARQTVSDCVDVVFDAYEKWKQGQEAAEQYRAQVAQEHAPAAAETPRH